VTSMIIVTVAHRSIKIVNKRLWLRIVGFVTLLSSDKNNQLLSGSQPAPREGESFASLSLFITSFMLERISEFTNTKAQKTERTAKQRL